MTGLVASDYYTIATMDTLLTHIPSTGVQSLVLVTMVSSLIIGIPILLVPAFFVIDDITILPAKVNRIAMIGIAVLLSYAVPTTGFASAFMSAISLPIQTTLILPWL